jgi:hypothetical protein
MHVISLGCRSGNPTLPNVGIEWSPLEATVRSTDRDQRQKPISASAMQLDGGRHHVLPEGGYAIFDQFVGAGFVIPRHGPHNTPGLSRRSR